MGTTRWNPEERIRSARFWRTRSDLPGRKRLWQVGPCRFLVRGKRKRAWAQPVLGLGFALVLLVAAAVGSVQAATTSTGGTAVTANVEDAISVASWPAQTFNIGGALVPEVPTVSGALSFTVRSNTTWGIKISSDDTAGKMREYDTASSSYVTSGKTLKNSLEWGPTTSGPWTGVSSTPGTMFAGQASTGDAGATVNFVLRLTASFDDLKLATGRVYRVVLTYTVGTGY
ncbi:MAG: hypothetical protein HYY08_02825 [Firmicutes bacterium]|nr:hypothetical protein [Bacillota bacterium]